MNVLNSGKSAGHKKLEAFFLHGNYHGIKKTFFPDGKTRNEVEYDNGMNLLAGLDPEAIERGAKELLEKITNL